MLDVTWGITSKEIQARKLVEDLKSANIEGELQIGYPAVSFSDHSLFLDALLISEDTGLIIFDILDTGEDLQENFTLIDEMKERQDDLFIAFHNRLLEERNLRDGRELALEIQVIAYSPNPIDLGNGEDFTIIAQGDLEKFADIKGSIRPELLKPLNSAIQRVSTLKPVKKRKTVTNKTSRGGILKIIEKEIANLDRWQNKAAVETPDGVQRIRGLAGSGKTVVLALKASYLHSKYPELNIAITFHTRSLYQQFEKLLKNFFLFHSKDEVDWSKLKLLHSWGSKQKPGIYSTIAQSYGKDIKTFMYGKNLYGYDHAFEGICDELLQDTASEKEKPIFDVVLIDEAQDLPISFFKLIYKTTASPKRIIYAYDELQNLGKYTMVPPKDLFGLDENGIPLVELHNVEGEPKQDIVLPICYRNTPWTLTIAHALGFGIYRKEGGIFQMFNDYSLWTEIGYDVLDGNLSEGKPVKLERGSRSTPKYFDKLLTKEDAIIFKKFETKKSQYEWVAEEIEKNLNEDELEKSDILIIYTNPLNVKEESKELTKILESKNLYTHIAGVTSSLDDIFFEDSIAITGIYRAKGNEAPIVYVLNSEYCDHGIELIKKRNILFTAISRSSAWVRVCGSGEGMDNLISEYREVIKNKLQLIFTLPDKAKREAMRKIHRDRDPGEITRLDKYTSSLSEMLEAIESGDLALENLSPKLRKDLRKLFDKSFDEDNDSN